MIIINQMIKKDVLTCLSLKHLAIFLGNIIHAGTKEQNCSVGKARSSFSFLILAAESPYSVGRASFRGDGVTPSVRFCFWLHLKISISQVLASPWHKRGTNLEASLAQGASLAESSKQNSTSKDPMTPVEVPWAKTHNRLSTNQMDL